MTLTAIDRGDNRNPRRDSTRARLRLHGIAP